MIIEAVDVTKCYSGNNAVDAISFSVKRGEIVGFVGANGAGKSTTINMSLGFLRPTRGEIRLFDKKITPSNAHHFHKKIGYAAGDMQLPNGLTGAKYIDFVSNVANIDTTKRLQQLEQIFQPQLNKKIGSLSRGNKQKIALIAAFCANPELVILDEPTSGLDPIMQEKFLQLVREEQQRGSTVFMSSHNLNEVADVCSRIILLRSGKVIKDVAASELLQKSGKQVRVVTGDKQLRPPAGAENIKKQLDADKNRILEFNWKHSPADLQHWVANIHKLIDIEITEFDLETAFQDMYEEGKPL